MSTETATDHRWVAVARKGAAHALTTKLSHNAARSYTVCGRTLSTERVQAPGEANPRCGSCANLITNGGGWA